MRPKVATKSAYEESRASDFSHREMASEQYRQFWAGFIEIYHENECLWRVKSADYSNRNKKNRAFQQLIEYSRGQNSSADIGWVKKKISNFRTVFIKEHKRVEESQRSGAGTDEVYKPTLWYYDLFKFTLEQEPRTRSLGSLDPESPILLEEEAQESLDLDLTQELEVEQLTPESAEVVESEESAAPQPRPPTRRRTSRRVTSAASSSQHFFAHAEEVLNRSPDYEQTFANFIAAEMRQMTEDQKRIHKRLVLDATTRAIDRTLVDECEIGPPARRHLQNVPPSTFPHHHPMQYAPGNSPHQMSYFPTGPTQPSPSPQPSTSSSSMYSDMPPSQASVLGDPRFFNL
ncbi:uncharacterized protein LOC135031103 [Pseudophryne corroboree]|uniref:uncharacterized protein LOC135031103 n=1 Tax=Pseudophryne corroboree TaxID=495146 RepID=UPI0030817E1B